VAEALGLDPANICDLSMALNPAAPDPTPVLRRHLGALRRYPEPSAATRHLAGAIGVEPRRMVLTNGGAEAIALVAADTVRGWVEEPEFSLYRRHLVIDGRAARWRSNPHSPSGRLAQPEERAGVWDEAFYPLATGRWTRGDADAGSVVVGSLTKLFAVPGLRLGYLIAPDVDQAQRLAARQPRWSVNGLAAAALPDLLDLVDLPAWAARVASLRSDLVEVLSRHSLEARPSDASWVLVEAPHLRDRLAPEGVVVRDCTSFGLPGVARIAVPGPDGLERLDQALSRTSGT
jgi:histidinol-phosphate/aromatic aminotransferase/cobyric acid decarboxylase-like protein